MDIVFLGSGAFGIPSLEALARSRHRIIQVITQPDRPAGRGKTFMPTPVAEWAMARSATATAATGAVGGVLRTEDVNDDSVMDLLRKLKPQCLVVIAFGQKLSEELLAIAPFGGVNLHSSLLPKYRGAAPIHWAVINGDQQAGVTVIEVVKVMDGGAILKAAATDVGPEETTGELHDRLALLGAPLLPAVLDQLEGGTLVRQAQEKALATRAPKLTRDMAWVDFGQPAQVVSARLRGMSPWPGVQVELLDDAGSVRAVATVLKCRASTSSATHSPEAHGQVLADRTVACGIGSLELLTVQPVGKRAMEGRAFANGYGFVPGVRLAAGRAGTRGMTGESGRAGMRGLLWWHANQDTPGISHRCTHADAHRACLPHGRHFFARSIARSGSDQAPAMAGMADLCAALRPPSDHAANLRRVRT